MWGTLANQSMQLKRVFLLSIVVGALVAMVYARSVRTGSGVDASSNRDVVSSGAGPAAEQPKLGASAPLSRERETAAGGAASERSGAPAKASAQAEKTAGRLAANETLTPDQLHGMLVRTFEGKLHDRELTPSEYDRLANAILKIRASQRVLNGVPDSADTAELRAVHVAALRSAFADVHDILGIPASALGDVLGESESAQSPPDESQGRAQ